MKSMKKIPREKRIFKLNPSEMPFFLRNPLTCWFVERAFSLNKLEDIYWCGKAYQRDENFCQSVLDGMGVACKVSESEVSKIPKEGPLVVVANHPFGGIEGIALGAFLLTIRPDVKIMANYILGRIPEMKDVFVLVDPFGSVKSAKKNIRPLRQCMKWLEEDKGVLGVFPSGEVSSIDLKTKRIHDPAWSPTVAGMIRKTKATVLPVYFDGHNGFLFQMMGLIHPILRTAMLPRMLEKRRNRALNLHVGAPLSWNELKKYKSDEELINYLRLRTYALEGRGDSNSKNKKTKLSSSPAPFLCHEKPVLHLEPLIEPIDPDVIAAEIAELPESAKLLSTGEMDVFFIDPAALPFNVLNEIGRLREYTFRGVGEGTGRSTDLDMFDQHYHHLFTWNREKKEIVGAYRLGLADQIVKKFGVEGLYTHTLFKFDHRFIDQLQPCVEMGRSFVRPEYQRSFSSLLLLWKGIGVFISRHPHYTTLFGCVSISNEYCDHSRHLILRSLSLSNFANDLAHLVKPRNPPKHKVKAEWSLDTFNPYISDVDNVSAIVQDIEDDKKGIPILLRQYLKLGGRLLAFNMDKEFSSVMDGLIAIELRNTDSRTRIKYMGEEAAAAFCKYHGLQ
ncbi:MAG: lysophospholipid acyltransferase family protein [Betaproteobacteria bacterium]|jgi:putative hemolysin|nr:lysophospholipid acyltransferase family protein [Betaproteobacteria bacterium]